MQQEDGRMEIQGMTCDHCVAAVTAAASRVPGLVEPHVDLASGLLSWHGPADRAAIRAAIEQEGYSAGP